MFPILRHALSVVHSSLIAIYPEHTCSASADENLEGTELVPLRLLLEFASARNFSPDNLNPRGPARNQEVEWHSYAAREAKFERSDKGFKRLRFLEEAHPIRLQFLRALGAHRLQFPAGQIVSG